MADLTDLFGSGEDLGGLGGLSHQDATTLALLKAMQNQADVGTRRTATPLGSIAQNLIPLFAAPIQARQLEQESALKTLGLKLKLAELLSRDNPDKVASETKKSAAEARLAEARAAGLEAQQAAYADYQKDPAAFLQKLTAAAKGQAASGDFGTSISLPNKPGEIPSVKLTSESPAAQRRFEAQQNREAERHAETMRRMDMADKKVDDATKRADRRDMLAGLKEKGSILNGQLKELDQQIETFKKDQTSRNWFWQGKSRPATPDEFAKQRELLIGQLRDVQNQILTTGQGGFDPTK